MAAPDRTRHEYRQFAHAYRVFNAKLFDGTLPDCLITLQRERSVRGYFWADKFRRRRGSRRSAEIALNPDTFPGRTDRQILSTLVHEMAHLWQAEFGRPSRNGYHNRQWAGKMREVGLEPSSTGRPGGKATGDRMTHYVRPNGPFAGVYRDLRRTGFRLLWESTPRLIDPSRNKVKFTCPGCGLNVWGAPGVTGRLRCTPCETDLEPAA